MTDFEKDYLENIRQVLLKNRVWIISVLTLYLLIAVGLVLFYQPKVKMDTTVLKQKEEELKAYKKQIIAYEGFVKAQAEAETARVKRDSAITNKILVNRSFILKIKGHTNEKVKAFDNYGSSDWTVYYSQLPEPER